MLSFARRYSNFTIFAVLGLAVTALLATQINPARALLIGFDCGTLVFLGLIVIRLGGDNPDEMRSRAADNEPDFHVLTLIALVIVGVVITAVGVELTGGGARHGGLALAGATLVLAWLFANTLFTLHYAHAWYLGDDNSGKDSRGLEFPGDDPMPDYWDFAYFAFVLGMTFQVSDVEVTSKRLRRLALLHGLLAYFFNIGVVALTVSLVASALG